MVENRAQTRQPLPSVFVVFEVASNGSVVTDGERLKRVSCIGFNLRTLGFVRFDRGLLLGDRIALFCNALRKPSRYARAAESETSG